MPRTNSLNTRIQLKIDTEAHWQQAVNFIPLKGEIIIYSADNTRPFCRLKVGDGIHTINQLSFIDAGSVNGSILEEIVQVYSNRQLFPVVGDASNIYINLADNQVYGWNPTTNQYVRLGGQDYVFEGGINGFSVTPSYSAPYTVQVTPDIPRNITGGGDADYLVKFDSSNTITSLVPLNVVTTQTENTKFLREDGAWATPIAATTNKVRQTPQSSTVAYFPPLFKYSTSNTEETNYVRFINNNTIGFHPVYGRVRANAFYIASTTNNTGLYPYANGYNTIGSATAYWNTAYVNHYYGSTIDVPDWRGECNIGTRSSNNNDAIRGVIHFFNECLAEDTQTTTALTANELATGDINIVLPANEGTDANGLLALADGSNIIANTTWQINISGFALSATRDSENNIIKDTYLKKSGGTLTGKLVLDGDPIYPLHAATKRYVDNLVSSNSTMVFKGTIGSAADNPTTTFLPDEHVAGWTYVVMSEGYYAGTTCYPGDLIICVTSGQYDSNSDWSIISTNLNDMGSANLVNTYLKLDGSNTMTGMLRINDANGIKINSNNHDLRIWEIVGRNSGFGNTAYGFYELYRNNNNTLNLYADNNLSLNVLVRSINQSGEVTWSTTNTFSETIIGSINGNAATATTATNLTGFKSTAAINLGLNPSTTYNAIGYVSGFAAATWNYQQVDGALYQQLYDEDTGVQIFQDYRSGSMSVRGKDSGSWGTWRRILDETNYSSVITLGTAAFADTTDFAPIARAVPATQTADNLTFLRNDNSWYQLTSYEIGTLMSDFSTSNTNANINDLILMQFVDTNYHFRTVGNVVTQAVVNNALGTASNLNNVFYRGDGQWSVPTYPITSVAGLTGDITVNQLRSVLTLSSALNFLGITTSTMMDGMRGLDGATNGAVYVDGTLTTPSSGDIVIDSEYNLEYLWTGSYWEQLGNDSSYKVVANQPYNYTIADGTNRWIRGIHQNVNGDITSIDEGALVTTGLWEGTANRANVATSATYDKNNNDIAETYVRKTGDLQASGVVWTGPSARRLIWKDNDEALQSQDIVIQNQTLNTNPPNNTIFRFRHTIDGGTTWVDLIKFQANGDIIANNFVGVASSALTANSWTNARKVYVDLDLASTQQAINGSDNASAAPIAIGVNGVLPVLNGGTGCTNLSDLRAALGFAQAMRFLGFSQTVLVDGSTSEYILLRDHSVPTQAMTGDIVIDMESNNEFIWTLDGKWERLGRDNAWALDAEVLHNSLFIEPGDIIYGAVGEDNSVVPTRRAIPAGSQGYVLTVAVENNALVPKWSTQTNITQVGTINAGVWHGSPITTEYGGTNNTSYTVMDTLIYVTNEQGVKFKSGTILTDGQNLRNVSNLTIGEQDAQLIPNTNNYYSLYVTGKSYIEQLVIGANNSYGNMYQPIYWNNGTPALAAAVQKKSFTFPARAGEEVTISLYHNTAYTVNTIVTSIVVLQGEQYLLEPIQWESLNGEIQLTVSKLGGTITGYILTASGIDLDAQQG